MKNLKIKSIAYHRNGVAGEGFNVVLFSSKEDKKRNFIATVFEGRGQVTVIDIDLAVAGCITFGDNSWRGDDFEPALREAITAWNNARDLELNIKQILKTGKVPI